MGFDLSEFHFDNKEVSHGARLWGNFIGLMLTHAWLEQRNREIRELRDGTRAVVATAEDYAAVYEIFKATSRRSVVNLSDTHQSIVQAVYDLAQTSQFPDDGFSTRAVAEEAAVSKGTVSKNRTFLTKSAGLLYDTEDGRLAISKDAEPSWWTVGDVMAGFPRVADVYAADGKPDPDGPPSEGPSGSKGDTSRENSGNEGNRETVGKKPDTYAAEPVSERGNGKETRFPPPSPESELSRFLSDPPEWFRTQADKHFENPTEQPLNPLCVDVAAHLYGTADRWREVKPTVADWLEKGWCSVKGAN